VIACQKSLFKSSYVYVIFKFSLGLDSTLTLVAWGHVDVAFAVRVEGNKNLPFTLATSICHSIKCRSER